MVANLTRGRDILIAGDAESACLQQIADTVSDQQSLPVFLRASNGQEVVVPESLVRAIQVAAAALSHGEGISISRLPRDLTVAQAAELLNVSRAYILKVVERGDITGRRDQNVLLVPRDELLQHRDTMAQQSTEALDELTQLSQELGLYDVD